MPTTVYIYGEGPLWSVRHPCSGVYGLERDLDDFLQGAGYTICEDEDHGASWHVDLVLREGVDVEEWIQRLAGFFVEWCVMDDCLFFTILLEVNGTQWEHRKIRISHERYGTVAANR